MRVFETPNYRMIEVKFLGPTNNLGSRIKISEPKRYNSDKTKSVILNYKYQIGDIEQQAFEYLKEKGFNIVGRASTIKSYIFFCDNWEREFKEIG